jgi:serine/threonine-protein kinase
VAALDHWLELAERQKAGGREWLRRVVEEADPDDWRARLRAARAHQDRRALEGLARAAEAAEQPPVTLWLLGGALSRVGAHAAAERLLRPAQERYTDDFWINHTLAFVLHEDGRRAEAVGFFRAAVALRPRSPGARNSLGVALLGQGDVDGAVAACRRASELQPDVALAHYNLGVALLEKGDLDGAVAACRRASELQPEDADAHTNLGNALRGKGDLDGAVAAYRRALALQPGHALAHLNLGVALVGQGDVDGAGAAFRRALEHEPENALAHYNLGAVLRDQGRFVDSLVAYQRAHELGSQQPGWRHPSAQWVREAERLVELDGKLDAFCRGEYGPKDSAERLGLAEVCRIKKRYRTAALLCAEAFAAEPKRADDLQAQHRYNAACYAALAAAGPSGEADKFGDRERARWRRQALDWLRADLAAYAKRLGGGQALDRALVPGRLHQWKRDPDLAGLRDPKALALLPGDEQTACQELWADVEALLRRAQGEG